MGDSRRSDGYAPTLQRSGDRARDDSPLYAAGTVLAERYRIETLLGEGGMGRVYAGVHIVLGRRVAIKVLLHRYADQPAMVERFRTEARSASRIAHPNIVPMFDFGETPLGEVFLVMDLLEGEPLSDVVKRGPLALDRLVPMLRQVALALRAAHEAGVVHRDLKPANVFLLKGAPGEPMRVQVLDFGMAKLVEAGGAANGLTAAGEILGTPEYMAPEQAVGGEIDRRTDVYAFGCMAFELWCGHPPFAGANYVTVLAKQLDEKAPRIGELRDAPAGLETLIARTLQKKREDRPKDMGEVLDALGRLAEEEGIAGTLAPETAAHPASHAPSSTALSRQSTRRRVWLRRRTRRALLALGLIAAGAAAGGLGWRAFGPARAASGPATLVLTTIPPGATLIVDGKPLEEPCPAVAQVQAGAHEIAAQLAHYHPAAIKRTVGAAVSEVVRMVLERDTYKMELSSDPPGAQVQLDGYLLGVTPMQVELDPLDPHTLRLERLGRRPWEVLVPQGERRTELRAVLKRRDENEK